MGREAEETTVFPSSRLKKILIFLLITEVICTDDERIQCYRNNEAERDSHTVALPPPMSQGMGSFRGTVGQSTSRQRISLKSDSRAEIPVPTTWHCGRI